MSLQLCRRGFKTAEKLKEHEDLSELHKVVRARVVNASCYLERGGGLYWHIPALSTLVWSYRRFVIRRTQAHVCRPKRYAITIFLAISIL